MKRYLLVLIALVLMATACSLDSKPQIYDAVWEGSTITISTGLQIIYEPSSAGGITNIKVAYYKGHWYIYADKLQEEIL